MKHTLCFVGSNGLFSLTALQTLLEQRINVCQIILAGYAPAPLPSKALLCKTSPSGKLSNSPFTVLPPAETHATSIPILAAQHHIPIHYVGNDINNFAAWETFPHNKPPEFLFIACFPFRLSAALREWPSKKAINLHPSLLPAYRGHNPIFWQLQNGEPQTGTRFHLLVDAFDTGQVILQKPICFPQGATRNELDSLLAHQGTMAFCELISAPRLNPREQDLSTASHHPLSQAKDYTLLTDWAAERAYNFIRGTHTPIDGYPILLNGQQRHILSALSYEPERLLGKAFLPSGADILIQFSPGVLRAKPV